MLPYAIDEDLVVLPNSHVCYDMPSVKIWKYFQVFIYDASKYTHLLTFVAQQIACTASFT